MKIILSIVLLFITTLSLKGQDCHILDSLTSYRGVKFGSDFPDTLKKVFKCDTLDDNRLRYDLWLPMTQFKKYHDYRSWFVIGETFDFVKFLCTPNKKTYSVMLVKNRTFEKPVLIMGNSYPAFYNSVIDELEYTFGTATYKNDKFEGDGEKFIINCWDCTDKEIMFSLSYKGKEMEYLLVISDKNIEKNYKREKYRN